VLPGLSGTTNPSATPWRPAGPSRVSGWSSLTTPWGFPCCVRFPCVHAAATTPVQRLDVVFARASSRISLPRKGCRVGLHIVLFEACSAFTRVTACTLARSPIRDPHSEGFSHFVTSMTAPVASGWSELPGGACTHWKTPPFTAHTHCGHSCWPAQRTFWMGSVANGGDEKFCKVVGGQLIGLKSPRWAYSTISAHRSPEDP
jgi:hypothetical protein